MLKRENRGFTIVELMAVIVIVGILATGILTSINSYMKKGKDSYNKNLDSQAILSSKNYFGDHQDALDKGYVTFEELASMGYLSKDFVDAYGNSCMAQSYVVLKNVDNLKKLTAKSAKYIACIKCDNNGYSNIKDNEECNVKSPVKDNKLTVKVNGGTIGGEELKSYKVGYGKSYTTTDLLKNNSDYEDKPNIVGGCTIKDNKVSVFGMTTDTTCVVTYNKKSSSGSTITLVLKQQDAFANDSSESNFVKINGDVSVSDISRNNVHSFTINVSAPHDRYELTNVICDDGAEALTTSIKKSTTDYTSRIDTINIKNESISSGGSAICTATYKARWIGVSYKTYNVGDTITYGDNTWTVVSNSDNSVKLALNSVASGSKNKKYSDSSSWLTNDWINNNQTKKLQKVLKVDRDNNGLNAFSSNVYVTTNSSYANGLTSYNYYVGSNKFYNANNRTVKKYVKKAYVNSSYVKNGSMKSTVYNGGTAVDSTISSGIISFNDLVTLSDDGSLVFKNAGTPEVTTKSGNYTDRYMYFKLVKSISKKSECPECECTSRDGSTTTSVDRKQAKMCYVRYKNYYVATVLSDGSVTYKSVDLNNGYGYFNTGNKALLDTYKATFNLCGGSYHGKTLELRYNGSTSYKWTSPSGNSYISSYGDESNFRIASSDSTLCPLSGNKSDYNGCTPKETGVPHHRSYSLSKASSCKSSIRSYTLADLKKSIYYRPYVDVRKR